MNMEEFLDELNENVDREAVMKACTSAATKIFGKADEAKCKRTVDAAIKKAKDTEDAIQIAINMMRGD